MTDTDTMIKLEGYCNRMPTIGAEGIGRDYVILGSHDKWTGQPEPMELRIENVGTRSVDRERYDYMSRGWNLEDGNYNGFVKRADDTEIPVLIEISTVC